MGIAIIKALVESGYGILLFIEKSKISNIVNTRLLMDLANSAP